MLRNHPLGSVPVLALKIDIVSTIAIWKLLEKPFLKRKRFYEAKQVEVEAIAA